MTAQICPACPIQHVQDTNQMTKQFLHQRNPMTSYISIHLSVNLYNLILSYLSTVYVSSTPTILGFHSHDCRFLFWLVETPFGPFGPFTPCYKHKCLQLIPSTRFYKHFLRPAAHIWGEKSILREGLVSPSTLQQSNMAVKSHGCHQHMAKSHGFQWLQRSSNCHIRLQEGIPDMGDQMHIN